MNVLPHLSPGRIMRRATSMQWRVIVVVLALGVLPLVAAEAALPVAVGTRLARVMAAMGLPSPDRIVSVTALQRRVARDPRAWEGRTVRVYAIMVSYRSRKDPFSWVTRRLLVDAGTQVESGALPVVDTRQEPVLMWLQRLPLIGRLLAGPQQIQWDRPAVYWIQLRAQQQACCARHTYNAAVLLDAPSDSVGACPLCALE